MTHAHAQYICGSNRWCIDIFPSMDSPASSHISFNQSASGTATNFTFLFTNKGINCFNPRIAFSFERIDYDGSSEYLNVYDNDNTLLATCTDFNLCDVFSICIDDQALNIDTIETNHTYQIRVYQPSSVNSLCDHDLSINAALELFCAKHPSPSPTTAPIAATGSPTAQTTSPTVSSLAPTQHTDAPTASPTAMPSAQTQAPTVTPTSATSAPTAETIAPTATTFAPTTAPTFSPINVPTATTSAPTSPPTSAPTFAPTFAPTTFAPTSAPTFSPTTLAPTSVPTSAPTFAPTSPPTVAPTSAPTFAPTFAPTTLAPTGKSESALYSLKYVHDTNASCANLVDNVGLKYNVNFTNCKNWCDNTADCMLFNYFENLKHMNHSRCYMFDVLCDITDDNILDRNRYRSVVGYFDFEAKCTDYPYDWIDNVGDDCADYKSQSWCTNNSALRNENDFYTFNDAVYHLNALQTCCECGGGIWIMDDVALSIDNDWNDIGSDILCKWMSNDIKANATSLRDWDNLILYDICRDLRSAYFEFDPCDALIDTQYDGDNYALHLCRYSEINSDEPVQFVMDLIFKNESNGSVKYDFYVNTLWFNLNTSYNSYYSPKINIINSNYSQCVIDIMSMNNMTQSHRYGAHPCHILVHNVTPITPPTIEPIPSGTALKYELYSLQYLHNNALCLELYENIGVKHNINISMCSEWCDDTHDCILFNYMDDLKEMNTSRCYIFDALCTITFNDKIQQSVIGYYAFKESCVDYPHDWVDNVADDCAYYQLHNWCSNQNILREEFEFYNLIDPKYNLRALDTCCECGGGATVMDHVVMSFDYWIRMDLDILCDWEHSDATRTKTELRSWDNLVLYNMCLHLQDIDCDFLIDSLSHPPEYGYYLYICNYSTSDIDGNEFIFDISLNQQSEAYDIYINTLWFTLDLSRYSSIITVIHSNYSFCFKDAADETRHAAHHYGAHACYILDTLSPTYDPTSEPTPEPTTEPTPDPTSEPTTDPTIDPTLDPTYEPTTEPTHDPTSDPTPDPTSDPTHDPTFQTTTEPTSGGKPTGSTKPPISTGNIIMIVISSVLCVTAVILFVKTKKYERNDDDVLDERVRRAVELAFTREKNEEKEEEEEEEKKEEEKNEEEVGEKSEDGNLYVDMYNGSMVH